MSTPLQFKLQTIIANSPLDKLQRVALESYLETAADSHLAKLITVFEKYPRAVAIFADFLTESGEQSAPLSPQKLEELLARALSKLV